MGGASMALLLLELLSVEHSATAAAAVLGAVGMSALLHSENALPPFLFSCVTPAGGGRRLCVS